MGDFVISNDMLKRYEGNGTRAVIPDGITYIESGAFSGCRNLSEIVIPDGVTCIREGAFRDTAYYNDAQNWEDGVLYIGAYLIKAQEYKSGSYTVKEGTRVIADCAFERCHISEVEIPEGVTDIGCEAFGYCSYLERAVIPDTVRTIGNSAFQFCGQLGDIVIPDGVKYIEGYAFYNTQYYREESNWENGVLYMGSHLVAVKGSLRGRYTVRPDTQTLVEGAFKNQGSLTGIALPPKMNYIGREAFCGCRSLEEIVLPEGIRELEDGVFNGCSALERVTLPDSLDCIGGSAFLGCSSLGEISLPRGVRRIGDEAFNGCSSLTELVLPEGLKEIGKNVFYGCISLTCLRIPGSVTNISRMALCGACVESITVDRRNAAYRSVDGNLYTSDGRVLLAYACGRKDGRFSVPDGVTEIGEGAFSGCKYLGEVRIPEGVTEIRSEAFDRCTALKKAIIPNSIMRIERDAFYGTECYGDRAAQDNGVLYIDGCLITAFKELSGSYNIKEGTRVIADGAFVRRGNITEVIIPSTVRGIGREAFAFCSSLREAVINEGVTVIYESAFRKCTALERIVIPDSITAIEKDAFDGCTAVGTVSVSAEKLHLLEKAGSGIQLKALRGILTALTDGMLLSREGRRVMTEVLDREDGGITRLLLSNTFFVLKAAENAVLSLKTARRLLGCTEVPELRAALLNYINEQSTADPFEGMKLSD